MKHLWKTLAISAAMALGACTDSPTSASSEASQVPEPDVPRTIVVPAIRGSEAGRFEIDALGTRQYVRSDDPISGGDNCYDVCDSDPGTGDGAGGYDDVGSGESGLSLSSLFTEAHFEGDIFKGHAQMTVVIADHAAQEMTLTTSRADGSTLGSLKFSTIRDWPMMILFPETLDSYGSMAGPKCGGRGQGITSHEASLSFKGISNLRKIGSQSGVKYQPSCEAPVSDGGGQTHDDVDGSSPTGGLRICHRLDHYSASGQFLYTETLYCYDVYYAT
jgi:hypothetical protein